MDTLSLDSCSEWGTRCGFVDMKKHTQKAISTSTGRVLHPDTHQMIFVPLAWLILPPYDPVLSF